MSVSDAVQRAKQNQASLTSLVACTMNLFLGLRAGGGAGIGGGGPCGSKNKVGYRSVILVNQRCPGQESPYTVVRQFIIAIATRKNSFAFFWKCTHVLHLQMGNHIQFAITNNNTQSWKGYKQTSKNKIHKS